MFVLFFYFKKAFDSVPHVSLISKLTTLNLNSHLLQWIVNYLSNRQQFIGVNGKTSTTSQILSRVPQESVLAPLLYLIYKMTSLIWNLMMVTYYSTLMIYHSIIQYNYCLVDYVHLQQIH